MQEKDFLYWLKSTFDLFQATSFNEKQTYLIKEHLSLMLSSQPNSIFGNWLMSYFDFNQPQKINEKEVSIIKSKLWSVLPQEKTIPSLSKLADQIIEKTRSPLHYDGESQMINC